MEYDQRRVGRNIRSLRKIRNLTINQLALLATVTPSFLGLVERGERGLSIEKICVFSKILGITLDELVFGEFIPKSKPTKINEEPIDGLLKQIEANLYGMNDRELMLVLHVIQEIRAYTKESVINLSSTEYETKY